MTEYRAVTPDDFEVKYDAEHTFPFFEDEMGDALWTYGHGDPVKFAEGVNEYDRVCGNYDEEDGFTAQDVIQRYGRAGVSDEDYPDEIYIYPCSKNDEFATPISIIYR